MCCVIMMERIFLLLCVIYMAEGGYYHTHPMTEEDDCVLNAEPPHPDSNCCGIDAFSSFSIVGGENAQLEQYPWLVSIEYYNNKYNDYSRLCGGSLISGRYVMTAAHCLVGNIELVGKPVHAYLGEYNTRNDGRDCMDTAYGVKCTDGALKMRIESYIPHPGFFSNRTVNVNDIGLIRLPRNAPYTNFIRPICLPSFDIISTLRYEQMLVVAGWGAVKQNFEYGWNGLRNYEYDGLKKHVTVPYRHTEFCREILGPFVNRRHICAGGEPGKDSCRGDSGGPLMYDDDGIYTVVGIVSAGSSKVPCGTEKYAAVYTNVFEEIDWIRQNIRP